jgi:DNA topoisomerase I
MNKINETLAQKRSKLKMLEDLRKALKTGKEMRGELKAFASESSAPKSVEQCQAKIAKLKSTLENEELKAKNKEDNKAVALGTSKINYMDPRITISWCKRREVPIEKIFPKTLRSKFAWAMSCPPGFNF